MKVLLITWDDPIPPGDSLGEAFREKGCEVSEIKYRSSIKVFQAKKEKIILEGGSMSLDLMDPLVLVGVFIGVMMPYVFSSLTMSAPARGHCRRSSSYVCQSGTRTILSSRGRSSIKRCTPLELIRGSGPRPTKTSSVGFARRPSMRLG